jgi:hypothetical protein
MRMAVDAKLSCDDLRLGGLNPLGRCTWGFQFSATRSIDKTGQIQRKASVKYWGADKELIIS